MDINHYSKTFEHDVQLRREKNEASFILLSLARKLKVLQPDKDQEK